MFWKRTLGTPTPKNLPSFIILTDRDDGTQWVLWHDQSENRIGISDNLPSDWNAGNTRLYPADQGPILLGRPRVRLLVRGGRLGMEVTDPLPRQYAADIDQERIMSRIGNVRYCLEVDGKLWQSAGILGWRVAVGDET